MHTLIIIAGILGGIGTPELILIALVVLLLFGGSKIPELMKGVGKGVRGFKEGLKGFDDDINESGKKEPDKNNQKANDPRKDNAPAG
ncbi:MAG: twin-arginine translocase TatA/TatE family subunit [Bacteroidetes bacterium]|nr:MAG: twin-arginine translocase TatA/TatE family subunit [Bacteroidota bacterium]